MRSLHLFKISMPLVAVAACLVLSPVSQAQSEIAPDHFDGTDSWQAAAHHKIARSKSQQKGVATLANPRNLSSRPTPLAGKHQTGARSVRASTIQNKRKGVAKTSKKVVAMRDQKERFGFGQSARVINVP
jgi:hypothetical protein